MGNILYTLFVWAYAAGFRIAALFNRKAKAGIQGRKQLFSSINNQLAPSRSSKIIWMHCASLGEFEQGRPVLESIKKSYPNHTIILTFFSASGFEAMKNYAGADHIFYLPFDSPANAKKLVDAFNPSLVLWVKYEYWYYYLHELKRRAIPVLLVSGIFREDQPFFKWYGKIWREMLDCFTHFFVQNESSKVLLATKGIRENVSVNGDTRFDRVIDIAENFERLPLVAKFCSGHKVIVAGSTWEDDEAELTHYIKANPGIKFIIAPHEIDEENLKDVKKEFPNSVFYSALPGINNLPTQSPGEMITAEAISTNVLIIDNVGMLSRLYHYADITYVGGGFGEDGVHNVLEAAVYGKPVIFGPEFEKFAEATGLLACGGAVTIQNALELEKELNDLWENNEQLIATGKAARDYVYAHKGASNKIIQYIQEKRLLTN